MNRPKSALAIFYPLEIGENNPILRKKSEDITQFTPEVAEFSRNLLDLMREYEGVGLAAPQIGKNWRIIATTQRKKMPQPDTIERDFVSELVLINPKIVGHSDQLHNSVEACLSLPGMQGSVKRYVSIEVVYFTPEGKKKQKKFSGYNAAIVQHEIDHLDGILFIDKLVQN